MDRSPALAAATLDRGNFRPEKTELLGSNFFAFGLSPPSTAYYAVDYDFIGLTNFFTTFKPRQAQCRSR
jgi:hypothetical protein